MSLRILFADDSMTAQNMGRKILTDAGYDVVAVSNGAAAVKKIAEQKPDIIILDVYMPGYSGLEVCEKVRSSIDTLKIPVLLTVGKMEPYRPEDANRVRADGVIVKPFEASDLLAIVKKLEERIVPRTMPVAEQTILLERPPEFAPPTETLHEPSAKPAQGIVDVPDHMATAAAFSDLLGMDHPHSLEPVPQPMPEPELEPASPPRHTPEPELRVASPPAVEPPAPAPVPEISFLPPQRPAAVNHSPAPPEPVALPAEQAVEPDTQPIPAYQEAEQGPVVREPERLEVEAAKPDRRVETKPPVVEQVEIPTPEPLPATEEAPEFLDPRLAIGAGSFDQFTTRFQTEAPPSEPPVSVSEAPSIEVTQMRTQPENGVEHASREKSAVTPEDDFEARVAAAMSIYDQPAEKKAGPQPVVTREAKLEPYEIEVPDPREFEPAPFPTGAPVSFAYSPPVTAPRTHPGVEVTETDHQPVSARPEPEHQTAQPEPPAVADKEIPPAAVEKVAAEIEAELPAVAAAAAADTGGDTQVIARVVHRVLERVKPELIAEISRELKSKK